MGFTPSRADQDLWWRKYDDYEGYDYISTHVDDFLIAAKKPGKYIRQIEKNFILRTVEDSPSYYLGKEIKRTDKGMLHLSCGKCVSEILQRYQADHGDLKKENIPISPDIHPENDDSPMLDDKGIKAYQHIIGVSQWLVTSGRFHIQYSVTSLS